MVFSLEEVVFNIVKEGIQKLNINNNIQLSDIQLNREYDKDGYGVVTNNEISAIHELAKNEGILLDPVYTGRAFYGMLDFLKEKRIPANSNLLFWHTGGFPAIFKYSTELK